MHILIEYKNILLDEYIFYFLILCIVYLFLPEHKLHEGRDFAPFIPVLNPRA